MKNLGVVRFMGRNVFCFLESGWLYISMAELLQRGLMPPDFQTVLTEPLLSRLYSLGDVSWSVHFACFLFVVSPLFLGVNLCVHVHFDKVSCPWANVFILHKKSFKSM